MTNRKVIYNKLRCRNSVFLAKSIAGPEIIYKRMHFIKSTNLLRAKHEGVCWIIPGHYSELEQFVIEYAFAKICAALGVGVKVGSPDHGFDIVCYEDCAEFIMEKCKPLQKESY